MSLTVGIRRSLDVTVLDLDGRITLGEGASKLRDTVRDLVWEGHKKIIMAYSGISYQDSSGFGELVSLTTLILNAGGELLLTQPVRRVHDLMQMTNLYSLYPVFATVEDAIAHFTASRVNNVE